MKTTEMAKTSQQDQSAVAAVRNGDAERYRELVERHERRVFAVAWSRLGDAALAEEVAQEAFIRGYRRLWLLGDGAKFAGWIASIARNTAINFGLRHRRELNKRERWALEQFSETSPGNDPAEHEPVHSPETLRQTVAELPAAHRECLVLFYLEGKSGAEAASALGISESALRVRLHRARAALRERLEDKLEGSLAQLRPSKSLVPAIMAGVLASSSAKAATVGSVGAAVTGTLAKIGITKWLLPLGSFFSFLFLLPMLLASWLMAQLELKNFRDQKGFRARMFRAGFKDRFLLIGASVIVGFVLIPLIARLVDLGIFSGTKPDVVFLLIAGFCFLFVPFSLRQLVINRNRFFMASVASTALIGTSSLLCGMNVIPAKFVMIPFWIQALITLPFYGQRPIRMDYNLFLRAAENLLPKAEPTAATSRRSKAELLAFARFLGTRWLVNHFRWSEKGLELRLALAGFSQWTGWTELMFNWSFRKRSQIRLDWDGTVTAQLGEKDRRVLAKFRQTDAIPQSEWETQVAAAVGTAWKQFAGGNTAAAEHALGQVAESDVFVVSPTKGGIAKVRWLMVPLFAFMILSSLGIHLPGCRAQMEKLNGLHPVSITDAQAHEFFSLINTNPYPLIRTNLNGREIMTRKGFEWDPSMALFTCLLLPETNLLPAGAIQAIHESVAGGDGFEAWKQSPYRVQSVDSSGLRGALTCGWIDWRDLNLQPSDLHDYLHTNIFSSYPREHWDGFLTRYVSWSWVKAESHGVLRISNDGVTRLRLFRDVDSLDLVNREQLIAHIVPVQALVAPPA